MKQNDFYHAAIKGIIYRNCPSAEIVDIACDVPLFNKLQAGFILKNCFMNFPDNTIHIICISSGIDKDFQPLVVKAAHQYFISWDNGIFSLLLSKEKVEKIIRVDAFKISTFPELEIFTILACRLANGELPENFGTGINSFKEELGLVPAFDKSSITGNIVYFDSYGNGITNITEELFDQVAAGRAFAIYLYADVKIFGISKHYHDVNDGEFLALFNSLGLLEIAVKNANMKTVSGLTNNSLIRIIFNENT